MICSAVLFMLLLLAYFIYADNTRKNNERKEYELEKAYSDKNLAKMEYDVAVYDDEVRDVTEARSVHQDKQEENAEQEGGSQEHKPTAEEILFGKVDDEGMEEITGNFKGDDN